MAWAEYRRKRGSFNVGLRVEQAAALLAALYANAHSKKGDYGLADFSPHTDKPEITLAEAMETWR